MTDDFILVETSDNKDILIEQSEDSIVIVEQNEVTEVIIEENIGPAGDAATIAIGTVTTLPSGSAATVSNSGTSQYAVFDFGIPEGEQGIQGIQGIQGVQGVQGIQGADGANGTPGSVWYSGSGAPSNGLGANGDYYLRTSNGDVYTKTAGSWGSPVANIKGPQGNTGATGATGPTGPAGSDAVVIRPQLHHVQNSDVTIDHSMNNLTIVVDSSGGHFNIYLPYFADVDLGFQFYVKDIGGVLSSNAVVLVSPDGTNIEMDHSGPRELRTDFGEWCVWLGEDSWYLGN